MRINCSILKFIEFGAVNDSYTHGMNACVFGRVIDGVNGVHCDRYKKEWQSYDEKK